MTDVILLAIICATALAWRALTIVQDHLHHRRRIEDEQQHQDTLDRIRGRGRG